MRGSISGAERACERAIAVELATVDKKLETNSTRSPGTRPVLLMMGAMSAARGMGPKAGKGSDDDDAAAAECARPIPHTATARVIRLPNIFIFITVSIDSERRERVCV